MFPSWEYTQLKKKKEPKPVFHKENTSNDLLGRHRPPCPTGAQERSVSGCAAGRRGPGPPRAGRRQHPHASREREQRTAGKKSSFFPEFAPAAVTVAPACRLGSHQEWGVHKGCGAWAPPRRACALTPETPCAKQTPAASSGVWSSSFTALSLGQSPHRDQDRNPGWGLAWVWLRVEARLCLAPGPCGTDAGSDSPPCQRCHRGAFWQNFFLSFLTSF